MPRSWTHGFSWNQLPRALPRLLVCLTGVSLLSNLYSAAPVELCQGEETQDQLPPEKLPPPQIIKGIGNVSLKITGNAEAQMWFNQGLNLIHDFWDYEALRAFQQGVRADPQSAMCYWGLYKAESFYHSNSPGYAAQALAKAVALKGQVTEQERLYIEASAAPASKATELWRELIKKYPNDTQARIFLANMLHGKEALPLLQSVLKDEPDNSAAHHYLIHNLEGTDHPQDALVSAEAVARLAPASGHMVHMPGHIYFRVGDYARAEEAFALSTETDERYMRDQQVTVDNDWNYVHNLMYGVANFLEEGKWQQATALSGKIGGARGELETTLYIQSARDSISRLSERLPVALRTANWTETVTLVSALHAAPTRPNLDFLRRQLLTFAHGMKAVETHDLTSAQELSTALIAELAQYPVVEKKPATTASASPTPSPTTPTPPPAVPLKNKLKSDALLQPILASLRIMSLELQGSLAMAQKNSVKAKALFAKATKAEQALGYHEPPNYIRPVEETVGAAMLAAGNWPDAKAAYAQALLERPRSGFALYGLAFTSEQSGNAEQAIKDYADFLVAWKDADADLPQVMHARDYLAAHPASPSVAIR